MLCCLKTISDVLFAWFLLDCIRNSVNFSGGSALHAHSIATYLPFPFKCPRNTRRESSSMCTLECLKRIWIPGWSLRHAFIHFQPYYHHNLFLKLDYPNSFYKQGSWKPGVSDSISYRSEKYYSGIHYTVRYYHTLKNAKQSFPSCMYIKVNRFHKSVSAS